MVVNIQKPYFLPWMGYFSKVFYSDATIILDDALFSKRKYIDRTKIIDMHGNVKWLGIPCGENYKKRINSIKIQNKEYKKMIFDNLYYSYATAPMFEESWSLVKNMMDLVFQSSSNLAEIDIELIKEISNLLKIDNIKFYKSSDMNINKFGDEKIIELCHMIGADTLLVGDGNTSNAHEIDNLKELGLKIMRQDFYGKHPQYYQFRRKNFEKGISIIDSIFNVGIIGTRNLLNIDDVIPYEI